MSEVISALFSALEPVRMTCTWGRENDVYAHPCVGVVWDSVYGPQGSEGRVLLPTKKPPFCSASFCVLCFVS